MIGGLKRFNYTIKNMVEPIQEKPVGKKTEQPDNRKISVKPKILKTANHLKTTLNYQSKINNENTVLHLFHKYSFYWSLYKFK